MINYTCEINKLILISKIIIDYLLNYRYQYNFAKMNFSFLWLNTNCTALLPALSCMVYQHSVCLDNNLITYASNFFVRLYELVIPVQIKIHSSVFFQMLSKGILWLLFICSQFEKSLPIKKIHKVDNLRGRAKEYLPIGRQVSPPELSGLFRQEAENRIFLISPLCQSFDWHLPWNSGENIWNPEAEPWGIFWLKTLPL